MFSTASSASWASETSPAAKKAPATRTAAAAWPGHPGCRLDVVVCESVSRVARRTFEGLSIERALDDAGVPLMPANEPMSLSGSRAQRILQRRINQSVAEYEVLNTLEQSWGGLCAHTREG